MPFSFKLIYIKTSIYIFKVDCEIAISTFDNICSENIIL